MKRRLLALIVLAMSGTPLFAALDLALPTDNDAIFHGGGAEFYQYIDRDYKGEKSKPWEGGQYGFVRNPVDTPAGIVFSRFHEGIDIRPVHRDANGEPQDEVRAIADGIVVHVNTVAAWSNYGNYIVIEHRWDGCPYYSLYGHLKSVAVRVGQHVARSEKIGVMGYTGEGLNRERAHVHLELNMLISSHFDAWHSTFFMTEPNHHGLYNGLNLVGLDIARLYLATQTTPTLTIPQFLANEEAFYRVAFPGSRHLEIVKRYPWLATAGNAGALEISFNRAGVPLKAAPASRPVAEPTVTYLKRHGADATLVTRGVVSGRSDAPALTDSGRRLMQLFIWPN